MGRNIAVISAAGSRKTERIIQTALAITDERVLITTYTRENQLQIVRRIEETTGVVPPNILVLGWFSFLINQCAKPYQRAITSEPDYISGLNFMGRRSRYVKRGTIPYYFDVQANLYRDTVSDLVFQLNENTEGLVVARLEKAFPHILIDEMQDLGGYDLEFLDQLLRSSINVLAVGDPRQHTLRTNTLSKNKKYLGIGIYEWLTERNDICTREKSDQSYRCNQQVCDFADGLFPEMPATRSVDVAPTHHDGIFLVRRSYAQDYFKIFSPVTVLRHDKNVLTEGLPAMNIGVSKGSTFDRVLIFPTEPMLGYLRDTDHTKLRAKERLYVAVTRARYSAAFVVPDEEIANPFVRLLP